MAKQKKLKIKDAFKGRVEYCASFGTCLLDENTPQEFMRKMLELSDSNWKYIDEEAAKEETPTPESPVETEG